jgi:hypothetical protein
VSSQYYNRNYYQEYNPEGRRLRGKPENRWWNCLQLINAKLRISKRGEKTELTERERRSVLDWSVIEEGEY